MKTWNVRVHRTGRAVELGQVDAETADGARCAALSRWGVADDEVPPDPGGAVGAILPADEFDVSPA